MVCWDTFFGHFSGHFFGTLSLGHFLGHFFGTLLGTLSLGFVSDHHRVVLNAQSYKWMGQLPPCVRCHMCKSLYIVAPCTCYIFRCHMCKSLYIVAPRTCYTFKIPIYCILYILLSQLQVFHFPLPRVFIPINM